nr:unnamed protein product [Digitaria exilis]
MVDGAAALAQAASSDPPPEPGATPRPNGAADEEGGAPAGVAAAAAGPFPPQQDGDGDEEDAADSPVGAAGERCRAMMEVVAMDGAGGKWKVSKLVVEHNHELQVAPGEVAATVPALGMEFDSADTAKEFYYGYGERVGFKARTGSNRRSVGDGEKIMQRFLCWRGNYAKRKGKGKDSDEGKETEEVAEAAADAGKRKREPYKTRSRNPGKKDAEVIEAEKGVGMRGAENGLEVQNVRGSRRGRSKKGMVEQDGESAAGLEVEKDVVEGEAAAAASDDEEDQGGVEEEVQVEVKRGRGRPRKAVTEDNTQQARVLRELGVRASQYNNEERKKILNKYLSKRQSRPASSRPTKIASRQALAERRKRGDGGRFLSSEGQLPSRQPSERRSKRLEKQNLKMEEKAESKEDEIIEAEPDPEVEVVAGPGREPKIGMVFLNEDKAYEFYANYAGAEGFTKASESNEAYAFLENQYEQLVEQVESEVSNSEPRRVTAKKNKNVEPRRQQQSPLDSSLLEPEEIEIPARALPPTVSNDIPNHLRSPTNQFLAPSHIMQAPYVAQQFGLGSLQGFPGMSPFGQIQEPTLLQQPSHLQPPPFHNGPQIPQRGN